MLRSNLKSTSRRRVCTTSEYNVNLDTRSPAYNKQIAAVRSVREQFLKLPLSVLITFRRIETAIQRYAAKRNMDSTRKNVFDKYLVHGGIEAGPKMFSGGE